MSQETQSPVQPTTSTPMSFAQALNEAKQIIVQQQYRIKADAERIKGQQQTIVDQSTALSEGERRMREQAAEIQRLTDAIQESTHRLADMTTAKEHADAVVDRQGERLTSLQASAAEMERRIAEQSEQIAGLTGERDALLAQLPTREDEEALASMSDLLSRRPVRRPTPMRLAEVVSDGGSDEEVARAEAA